MEMDNGFMRGLREIRTKSVINPLLWPLAVLVICIAFIGSREHANPVAVYTLCGLLVVYTGMVIKWYSYFAKNDPDRLQSETHRENILKMNHEQARQLQQDQKYIQGTLIDPPVVNPMGTPTISRSPKEGT